MRVGSVPGRAFHGISQCLQAGERDHPYPLLVYLVLSSFLCRVGSPFLSHKSALLLAWNVHMIPHRSETHCSGTSALVLLVFLPVTSLVRCPVLPVIKPCLLLCILQSPSFPNSLLYSLYGRHCCGLRIFLFIAVLIYPMTTISILWERLHAPTSWWLVLETWQEWLGDEGRTNTDVGKLGSDGLYSLCWRDGNHRRGVIYYVQQQRRAWLVLIGAPYRGIVLCCSHLAGGSSGC